MEGGEGLGVVDGASSEGRLWVRDLVGEVSVGLGERSKYLLGSGGSFCSYSLVLIVGFWARLSLDGSEVEWDKELEVSGGTFSGARLQDWGIIVEVLVVLQEQTGDFLGTGAAFCLSVLGLMGSLRSGLSLTRLGVECRNMSGHT